MNLCDVVQRRDFIRSKLALIEKSNRKDFNIEQVFKLIDEEVRLSLLITESNFNSIVSIDNKQNRLLSLVKAREAIVRKLSIINKLLCDDNIFLFDEELWHKENSLFEEKLLFDRIIFTASNIEIGVNSEE